MKGPSLVSKAVSLLENVYLSELTRDFFFLLSFF